MSRARPGGRVRSRAPLCQPRRGHMTRACFPTHAAAATAVAQGGSAYDHYMEQENDAQIGNLAGKVTQLRELSIQIGSHVREDNRMLGDLDGSFDTTGGLLGGTMKRCAARHPMALLAAPQRADLRLLASVHATGWARSPTQRIAATCFTSPSSSSASSCWSGSSRGD